MDITNCRRGTEGGSGRKRGLDPGQGAFAGDGVRCDVSDVALLRAVLRVRWLIVRLAEFESVRSSACGRES